MGLGVVIDLLRCPHCTGPLSLTDTAVTCHDGHRFDIARQGYVNLLCTAPPRNADTAAMVGARLQVLQAGLFDSVVETIAERWPSPATVVEPGAGPGWYLAQLVGDNDRGLAGDISVAAARRAARAHPRIGAAVWDTWRPWPVVSREADLVVDIFAPRNAAESARVLHDDGLLVTVTPTPDHLQELRSGWGLLEVARDKSDRLTASLDDHFHADGTTTVRQRHRLTAELASALIAMGPNAFHGSPTVTEEVTTTVAVEISWWRRRPDAPCVPGACGTP